MAILRDHENLDDEVEDLNAKLDDEHNTELLTVYRKLKMLNFVRIKLMERIISVGNMEVGSTLARSASGSSESSKRLRRLTASDSLGDQTL